MHGRTPPDAHGVHHRGGTAAADDAPDRGTAGHQHGRLA